MHIFNHIHPKRIQVHRIKQYDNNTIFGRYQVFIYVKSKFNSYPYYFNIFFCVTISLNNIIRLITSERNENEEPSAICKVQAIFLTFSDKLILTYVCSYSVINYLGMTKTEFYKRSEKAQS